MLILSMDPVVALIPNLISIPSKAGPEAQESAMTRSLFPRSISVLVPTSMAMIISSDSIILDARITATLSAPTKPPITGRWWALAPG